MFVVVFIAVAIAVVALLVTVVCSDRSLAPPRSHSHEIDPHSARVCRAS